MVLTFVGTLVVWPSVAPRPPSRPSSATPPSLLLLPPPLPLPRSVIASRPLAAASSKRLHFVDDRLDTLWGFRELLAFGLAMGVDDGCEPTAEEVAAGV